MKEVYAFTDESGAFGWKFDVEGSFTHFIIASIIVEKKDLDFLNEGIETIRSKYFKNAEIKSSKIGSDSELRRQLITDLLPLPFSIFAIVIDKRKMAHVRGLRYKQSFYKFTNNILHKEIRKAFPKVTVIADEIGGSEFMKSFSNYFRNKSDQPDLFGEADFSFRKSHEDVTIQLADIIAGSIARKYDERYNTEVDKDFIPLLNEKIIRIQIYPYTFENYKIEESPLATEYDLDIANLCLKQAVEFIQSNRNSDDLDTLAQVNILDYLLFRFMNNDLRRYISTKELTNLLEETAHVGMSMQAFRTRIIANLRDKGIIIASSSSGYKIPSKESELFDFINHGTSIIIPMISRLKKCRELVKLGTNNKVDLFDKIDNKALREMLEN